MWIFCLLNLYPTRPEVGFQLLGESDCANLYLRCWPCSKLRGSLPMSSLQKRNIFVLFENESIRSFKYNFFFFLLSRNGTELFILNSNTHTHTSHISYEKLGNFYSRIHKPALPGSCEKVFVSSWTISLVRRHKLFPSSIQSEFYTHY